MLAPRNSESVPEENFKEKVRCGEVYRNLNGNEMFQKFYYRCLECSMDFESSPEFEEHVIVHYLQDDADPTAVENSKTNENIISISSGDEDDEEENDYLYAFEVASLVEENVSENDLPLPLMQMLGEHSADSCDKGTVQLDSESDGEGEKSFAFPCDGLRRQALHPIASQYSEHCCTQCPAYFNTKSELIFHLHVHTLPNTVACPHCYEAFPNNLKLNEHLNISKRKRNHKVKSKATSAENIQNCKKAKNQIQDETLQLQSEENSTPIVQNCTEKESHTLENGQIVDSIISTQQDVPSNDTNCLNDSANLNIPRKNHITNDT